MLIRKKLPVIFIIIFLLFFLLNWNDFFKFIGQRVGHVVKVGFIKKQIVLYKSPNCGCCVKYVSYLEEHGFKVKTVARRDMDKVKQQYEVPLQMESCHTAVIGGYFVEGHVPIEAINKLLEEKPSVDGIALPQMPAGTPGMPGVKQRTWLIYALKDGKASKYINL